MARISSEQLNSGVPLSSSRTALAILALAVGGFGIGTGEFSIMGLLPELAAGLGIDETRAGGLISAYALGVVVGAPLIAVGAARWPRRWLLLALMGLYAAGNFASALVPGFLPMLLVRFVSGLPHGAYFGVAALVAASLVEPHRRGRAVGRVMLGLTVATLIGNPIAVWLGQLLGWRSAFAAVGMISLLTVALLVVFLPDDRTAASSSPLQELGALRNPDIWLTLGIGAIGFGGMFCVLSYIAPTLTQVSGLSPGWVPVALAAFGLGTIIGSQVGGWLADRGTLSTIGWILLWSLAVMLLFPFAARSAWSILPATLLVGTIVAMVPALQIRLMDVAADAQTLAASLNHSAFNVGNALGAWLGGIAAAYADDWAVTGWVGALLAIGGLVLFVIVRQRERG
ncbi:MFS transporter [Halotalea alkalilenta]|uniref:MFS transporter n=1 Tax=Halotalea alkalilenta TaxID=376489 RepID=UPI000A8AFF30|nr:MFS transporter [Halotalea alkalilenta]